MLNFARAAKEQSEAEALDRRRLDLALCDAVGRGDMIAGDNVLRTVQEDLDPPMSQYHRKEVHFTLLVDSLDRMCFTIYLILL